MGNSRPSGALIHADAKKYRLPALVMMDIRDIKEQCLHSNYEISFHAEKERYAEDISLSAIETAILNGELLEDYPDDPRSASCLVLGYAEGRPMHIVCGYTSTQSVRIITVYVPKLQNGEMREREEGKERIMYDYGDCSFCGGEVREAVIELDYRYKGQLYVFRNVPTGVCQQCGEKYLVASIAKTIEHDIRTKKDWSEMISVPVKTFSEVSAT